jgi:hypothetical protein
MLNARSQSVSISRSAESSPWFIRSQRTLSRSQTPLASHWLRMFVLLFQSRRFAIQQWMATPFVRSIVPTCRSRFA